MEGEVGQGPLLPSSPSSWGPRHPSLRKATGQGRGLEWALPLGSRYGEADWPVGLWTAPSRPFPTPTSQSQGVVRTPSSLRPPSVLPSPSD